MAPERKRDQWHQKVTEAWMELNHKQFGVNKMKLMKKEVKMNKLFKGKKKRAWRVVTVNMGRHDMA